MSPALWRHSVNPIGIDIGASGVKLLQLRSGRAGWHVVAAAHQPFEQPLPDALDDRRRLIARAVRTAISSAPFAGRSCVCSISNADVMLRATRLPRLSDEELVKATRWEAADRFGIDPADLEVDWLRAGEVVQGDEARDEIILIGARRDRVESQIEALLDCRLFPHAVDLPAAANVRSLNRLLRRASDQNVVRIIIDVGVSGASVMITRGQEIAFLKPIEIGGRVFTQAVAESLDLQADAAHELRVRRIRAQSADDRGDLDDQVDRMVFEAVRPHMYEIAQEASLCLRYYSVTFRGVRPEIALVVGGDGAEPGLCEVLEDSLNIKTALGRPLEGVDLSKASLGDDRRHSSWPEWSVATGLSLRTPGRTAAKNRPAPGGREDEELRAVA